MDAIDHIRGEIKSYYPKSAELQLSNAFARHRRFNFYFKIEPDIPYLLYLNWDGDGDRFTLKCLEFETHEMLTSLVAAYPDKGSNVFNIGRPRSAVSFIYYEKSRLRSTELRGIICAEIHYNELDLQKLMECVDPTKG
jgi:hypothetical protein